MTLVGIGATLTALGNNWPSVKITSAVVGQLQLSPSASTNAHIGAQFSCELG